MESSDIEHFATMVAGCECINSGNFNEPDARYTQAVLKLHVRDSHELGAYVGAESFLDKVKKGAEKTGEFVKKLYQAIVAWFKGAFLSTKGKVNAAFKVREEKVAAKMRSKAKEIMTPKIESLAKEIGNVPEGVDYKGYSDICEAALKSLGETATIADTGQAFNRLLEANSRVSTSFSKYCQDKSSDEKEYAKAVHQYKTFADKVIAFTNGVTALYEYKVKEDK